MAGSEQINEHLGERAASGKEIPDKGMTERILGKAQNIFDTAMKALDQPLKKKGEDLRSKIKEQEESRSKPRQQNARLRSDISEKISPRQQMVLNALWEFKNSGDPKLDQAIKYIEDLVKRGDFVEDNPSLKGVEASAHKAGKKINDGLADFYKEKEGILAYAEALNTNRPIGSVSTTVASHGPEMAHLLKDKMMSPSSAEREIARGIVKGIISSYFLKPQLKKVDQLA